MCSLWVCYILVPCSWVWCLDGVQYVSIKTKLYLVELGLNAVWSVAFVLSRFSKWPAAKVSAFCLWRFTVNFVRLNCDNRLPCRRKSEMKLDAKCSLCQVRNPRERKSFLFLVYPFCLFGWWLLLGPFCFLHFCCLYPLHIPPIMKKKYLYFSFHCLC